jgi:4-hydroxy-tetrahydrodipicolinate reductase
MKIILSGYGKMGKVVEQVALARGHEIAARIDLPADWENLSAERAAGSTVIDFSIPSSAVGNIRRCFDLHLPVVIGTTGWNEDLPKVKEWVIRENQSLFFASNFSIGVNLVFEVTRTLAGLLDKFPGYDVRIDETHHIHKLDAPSGTAITLAESILSEMKSKRRWVKGETTVPEELGIISHRTGEVPGIHSIICESEADSIILTHEAKNRNGLATGAVMAAEWLQGRTGFFQMRDMLM